MDCMVASLPELRQEPDEAGPVQDNWKNCWNNHNLPCWILINSD